jgi:uncharacterized protein (DUF924 family)
MEASEVIKFWFEELSAKDWYKKDLELDLKIKERFESIYKQAINGELFSWRETIEGRLAEIIVLDQFSRNMFRDQAEAFKYDSLALILAQEASKVDSAITLESKKKAFLYMPLMHSESIIVHDQAVRLFSEKGLEGNLEFEHKHRVIIERFGRYPHRNKILGRNSTPEEVEFLAGPGSSF